MMLTLALLTLSTASAQEGTVSMGPGTPDYYVIQPGDTLWDISTRFLADAQVWPELWSYNEYITNPHWIYPGNKIYFRLGDPLNPPSAGISEPTGSGYTPPRQVEEAPEVACDFPPRFNQKWEDLSVTAPGIIAEPDDLGIRGKVIAADEPGVLLGEGALVYLDLGDDAGDVECGQILGVYKRQGRHMRGPDREFLGYPYRVLALVQALRVDGDTVTGVIRDSYAEIQRGDVVGDPVPVEMTVDVDRPDGDDIEATIIARLTEEQDLPSTGETVFLDHGTNDGIDVGQSLYIVEQSDGQEVGVKADERLPERVVGRVIVVRSEPAFATGVVVNAARDVQVGLRVTTRPNAR